MRHQLRCRHLRVGQRHGQQRLAFAPALSSRGVHEAPGSTALIAPACVTLRLQASHRRAARGAIDLAPVAAAAYQRRRAAACTQEASRRLVVHEHPSKLPRVCWTGSSTGATITPHPVYDTVKGAAVGTYLPVGTQEASRRLVVHEHPSELPRVCCWTGSSTGATLALHPLSHDTVKGTANGSNCQVGAAAVPAYLGVGPITAPRLNAPSPGQRPAGVEP